MPFPALFNEPYDRELEMARYFQGFGGLYAPDVADKRIPRFVRTAVLIRDYDPAQDAVEYGLKTLERIKVNEVPDWSVLVDIRRGGVYFRTALNPELKTFSLAGLDFSNRTPALVLNMDRKPGGDVTSLFHPATEEEIEAFLASLPFPESLFAEGGITKADFVERFATHPRAAAEPARHSFAGTWATQAEAAKTPAGAPDMAVELKVSGDAVTGEIRNAKGERYGLDHIHLVQNNLTFTFRNLNGTVYIAKAALDKDRMDLELWGIDGFLRGGALKRQ
jgi:choloylglycine hydrolase